MLSFSGSICERENSSALQRSGGLRSEKGVEIGKEPKAKGI